MRATKRSVARTIVVGDVHGCISELESLVRACKRQRGDRLVVVGDVVAKGPSSRECIEFLREVDGESVRGNHDQAVIDWWRAKRKGRDLPRLSRSAEAVVDELDEEHFEWLEDLPYTLELDDDHLVVHAGLMPGVSLKKQDEEWMIQLRSILPGGQPSSRAQEGTPWGKLWKGPPFVLFGHDAVRGLQRYKHALGLDTGCVYGRELTAAILPERKLVSVPARRAYTEVRARAG